GITVYGKGVSTDIIEASGKAYLNAINFYLVRKETGKKIIKGA
ncbi:MAG TPA: alpha-isopropylmalate synthase regulatory domain-containing protein, partial [bacterium]|nr:alpha-isopropylmalate synthase regulatory domain-containing protein [bacterium]